MTFSLVGGKFQFSTLPDKKPTWTKTPSPLISLFPVWFIFRTHKAGRQIPTTSPGQFFSLVTSEYIKVYQRTGKGNSLKMVENNALKESRQLRKAGTKLIEDSRQLRETSQNLQKDVVTLTKRYRELQVNSNKIVYTASYHIKRAKNLLDKKNLEWFV